MIEPISNVPHIKTVLCTRFVQFITSLSNCHKLCIRLFVDHDLRTVLCKNLESIAQDCNVQSRNLNKFCVKQNIYIHIVNELGTIANYWNIKQVKNKKKLLGKLYACK